MVERPKPQQLILTVTRACNLRCSYCPTVKDGWPSLSPDQARQAVRLFVDRYGGGTIKMFGGEPLLVPDVVQAAMAEAEKDPRIDRIMLSTNGLGLDRDWLERLRASKKSILTLSMDGHPDDHRKLRRALNDIPDAYDHVVSLLDELHRTPRVVVTQTIAPTTAARAHSNFQHLRALGFKRFNLLPGYFIPWRSEQLDRLTVGFEAIGQEFLEAWKKGQSLYLRNLFTWAPTPFFNSGLVVDADGSIHPSNVGLSGKLDGLRSETCVGTLDDPPTPEDLQEKSRTIMPLLEETLSPLVLESTRAVDARLSDLCRRLYPAWAQQRVRRNRPTIR